MLLCYAGGRPPVPVCCVAYCPATRIIVISPVQPYRPSYVWQRHDECCIAPSCSRPYLPTSLFRPAGNEIVSQGLQHDRESILQIGHSGSLALSLSCIATSNTEDFTDRDDDQNDARWQYHLAGSHNATRYVAPGE